MVEYIQELPKEYEAVLTNRSFYGYGGYDGNCVGRSVTCFTLDEGQVREVLQSFVGEIEQIPPMFSAVKDRWQTSI